MWHYCYQIFDLHQMKIHCHFWQMKCLFFMAPLIQVCLLSSVYQGLFLYFCEEVLIQWLNSLVLQKQSCHKCSPAKSTTDCTLFANYTEAATGPLRFHPETWGASWGLQVVAWGLHQCSCLFLGEDGALRYQDLLQN